MDLQTIEQLTILHGEGWGIAHVRRVLGLIEVIGHGLEYDLQVVRYAAYLHDWGAFPHYRQPGVEHAARSRAVAEREILPHSGLPPAAVARILEAIEHHDLRCPEPVQSVEALLVREADCLDFLGAIGLVKEFAWGPNNLRQCYERVQGRIALVQGRFTLPAAQKIAQQRIAEMQAILGQIMEESQGFL